MGERYRLRINGATAAFRSRELVTRKVIAPLHNDFSEDVVAALEAEIQLAVYGDKGGDRKSRQTLLLGEPELKWLKKQAEGLALQAAGDAKAAADAAQKWRKNFHANIKTMRDSTSLPAGLVSALFGRMVWSLASPHHG